MERKRIKKQKYFAGGLTTLMNLGAPLLNTAIANVGNYNNQQAYEEERKAREEQIATERARLDQMRQQAILEQFPVEGTYTPRFEMGGGTPGDPRTESQMAGFRTAMGLDSRAGMMALDHPEFADMFNKMTPEEIEMLKAKKAEITAQAEGIRGKGVGPALEMFSDLDLSFIKPLRERAGISKGDLTDWTLDTLGVEGGARQGAKAAAFFKSYEDGGDTNPSVYQIGSGMSDTIPNNQYFRLSEPLGPNMPIGGRMFGNGYGRWFQPEDSPNGEIRQWDPSMWDYLQQAAMNTRNPMTILADSDYLQRTGDRTGESFSDYNWTRLGLKRMEEKANTNPNDIFPDWVYGLAGIQPKKAMGGIGGGQYEAEGGEMIEYKAGDRPKVYGAGGLSKVSSNAAEIKGPSHKAGGVDMSDEKGARIYSDKLTADPALVAKLMKL